MNDPREWNPYYVNSPYTMNPEHRAFPWLYPYGSQMNYWNLWDSPERMEDEMDTMRLRELYPLMARRLQPYVEEVCTRRRQRKCGQVPVPERTSERRPPHGSR